MEALFSERYRKEKENFLSDESVNSNNRRLFRKFFEEHEHKLKRMRGLKENDEGNYKTLYSYIRMLKTANKWFSNKDWKKLTKSDIKKVYEDLEDGKILNMAGEPYINLADSYYSKVFKSRPFEMAGKLQLAKEVIKYTNHRDEEVRFITEEDFRKMVDNAFNPHHRLLFWLAWDIGENINSLLRLKKSDFYKQQNPHTKDPEYRVTLRKEILKRTRRPRAELTNYKETVELLDQHLEGLKDEDTLFNFDYRNAKKIIDRSTERSRVRCIPNGRKPTWKDLRSGMACDMLKKGYNSDEVNARLGHRPSSSEIDKYINFLAIDRHQPKQKVQQFQLAKINEELEESKEREKILASRIKKQSESIARLIENEDLSTNILFRLLKKAYPNKPVPEDILRDFDKIKNPDVFIEKYKDEIKEAEETLKGYGYNHNLSIGIKANYKNRE